MKTLPLKKKTVVVLMLAVGFILSLVCAFGFGGTNVNAASDAEIKTAYQDYLLTYTGTNPERDFIDANKDFFESIGYDHKDKLTDDAINRIYDIFGVNKDDVLSNGATIGDANKEKFSGKYVSSSANGVSVGGDSLNDGDFSIIVMGDQQTAVEYHSAAVAATYDYIAANKDAMNLKMFINVGDIVDDTEFISWREPSGNPWLYVNMHPGRLGNYQMQGQFAITQAQKLLDAGIPSAYTMGNHDYGDMAESYRIKDGFNRYFTFDKFSTTANGFGGSLYNDIEAAWYEFTANGQKYMVIVLGCYPTTEILNWANEVVSTHPEHKVIVSTHSYFNGTEEDYREEGNVIWDDFVSKHENIFMLVCGHECTSDGSVVRKVDFGDNGNTVTQFMINPQIEEFGGAGTFAQLIFRTDGTVDFVYYSPFANANNDGKGYFLDKNQFTFSLSQEKIEVSDELKAKETVVDEDFYTDAVSGTYSYLGHDTTEEGKARPTKGIYAYNNVLFTENALTVKESGVGYVVHKLYAGKYNRFTKLSVKASGRFTDADGVYQIDVSADGINYSTVIYNNAETGSFDHSFDIDRFIAGAEYVYVRVLINNASVYKLVLDGSSVRTVYTDKSFVLNYSFANNVNASDYNDWDMNGAYSKYYACLSGNVLGSGGNGRMFYKSYVTYRFDSGSADRYFKSFTVDFTFKAQYLRSQAESYDFSQQEDLDYILGLSVSVDGGKTFVVIKNYTEADCGVSASTPTKDFWVQEEIVSDEIIENSFGGENVTSFILKIDYFGAGPQRAHAGLYNINLSGALNKTIKEKAESTKYTRTFELFGGYFERKSDVIPKKSGYTFEGWYLTEDFSGSSVNPDDDDYNNGDFTFYAKWSRGYYITYVLDGGTNSDANVSLLGKNSYVTLVAPVKEGKSFVGWYDSQGKKYTKIEGSQLSDDLVLYAVWEDTSNVALQGCSSGIDGSLSVVLFVSAICIAFFVKKRFAKR